MTFIRGFRILRLLTSDKRVHNRICQSHHSVHISLLISESLRVFPKPSVNLMKFIYFIFPATAQHGYYQFWLMFVKIVLKRRR